jgi:hypothetical protein
LGCSRVFAIVAWAAALLGCSTAAFAQATPSPAPSASPGPSDPCGSILSIVNRPTIGTGVCTVRTGRVAVETGWLNTMTTGNSAAKTAMYGISLLRFGTDDPHLDLEVTPPNAMRTSSVTGVSDTSIGAKYELGYDANAVWGVNAQLTLPTGSKAFTAGGPQYIANFNWGYTINSVMGLSGTVGMNEFSGVNAAGISESYFSFVPTLEGTATLPGSSELFAEYAYFSAAAPGAGAKTEADFGYIRDFGSHLQFDVEYGYTPTVVFGQQQHYVGAGLSFMN